MRITPENCWVRKAREIYATEPSPRTFEQEREIIRTHPHGYVFEHNEYFVMGRGVHYPATYEQITNPRWIWADGLINAWHIHVAAGNVRLCWTNLPHAVRWFSFERRNRLRIYDLETFQRRFT